MDDEYEEPTPEQRAAIEVAKGKLDQAVLEYYSTTSRIWENDNPGMVLAWTLGLAISRIDRETGIEENPLQIESSPGINNFFASGVAMHTAEAFADQARGE
jgi:hypothetical protein